jgi:FkbM family methyltransferase
MPTFHGQYLQDKFVRETFFPDKRDGTFLDIGADDGVDRNNTLFFEELGWTGICIEPSPSRFPALARNRRCECLNVAVSSTPGEVEFLDITGWGKGLSGIVAHYDPRHVERIERETTNNPSTRSKQVVRVPAVTLGSVLQARKLTHIDYCSIDVEGAELDVLSSVDLSAVTIRVMTVEDNYGDPAIPRALAAHGYTVVATVGQDLVFARAPAAPARSG